MEMFFVEESVFNSCFGQRLWQMRFPDPLSQPDAPWLAPEILGEEFVHQAELPDPVFFGDDRQHRLVEPAAQEFELATSGHFLDQVPGPSLLGCHVLPERSGKMEGEVDGRMPGPGDEKWLVAVAKSFLENRGKIPHRLVVVDGEKEDRLRQCSLPFSWLCGGVFGWRG